MGLHVQMYRYCCSVLALAHSKPASGHFPRGSNQLFAVLGVPRKQKSATLGSYPSLSFFFFPSHLWPLRLLVSQKHNAKLPRESRLGKKKKKKKLWGVQMLPESHSGLPSASAPWGCHIKNSDGTRSLQHRRQVRLLAEHRGVSQSRRVTALVYVFSRLYAPF